MSGKKLSPQAEPIAVVGIACRFPGGMNTMESFWQVLKDKKDVVGQFPEGRISNVEEMIDPGRAPGKIISGSGGFIDEVDKFDATFFNISPKEAEKMDPQQRILLELTYEAMEDAGVKKEDAWGSRTAVFAGLWTSDYEHRMLKAGHDIDVYATTGTGRYGASGRISYIFNFQGPCMTVDTACSSSIVAVHLAAQSLLNGESDMAVAAAANLILDSFISVGYSRSGLLAPYGRCRFGSQEPRGYVRSEGAAVVLMKTLSKAFADGDNIYSIVTGTSCNSDGQSHKYMLAPSFITQETLIRDAVQRAGIKPADVQYVEAHGTGTKAGDPAELKSIPAALQDGRAKDDKFIVGSIKTNIGHTEAVAGLAALIKTTLAIQHRLIPASLHSDEPQRNPDIPWNELPLEIPTDNVSWPHPEKPLIAGVNSFGISGINAHAIVQEAPKPEASAKPFEHEYYILPVSGAVDAALAAYVEEYLAELQSKKMGQDSLLNWIKNVAFRKSSLAERVVFVGKTQQELVEAMQAFLDDTPHERVIRGTVSQDNPCKVAAIFPGQGSQWAGMGKELYEKEHVFRETIDACEKAYSRYSGWKLTDELFRSGNDALATIDVIQPAIVAIEVAVARQLQSWGLDFRGVIGHSMGEAASAYISGAITIDDMANIICTRSSLMKRTSGQGAMGYIGLPAETVEEAIKGKENLVGIGVVNSPQSAVISGDPSTVDAIIAEMETKGAFCRRVKVDVASHSPQMDPLMQELENALTGMNPSATAIPFYSSVLAGEITGANLDKTYWTKNLRNKVQFGATIQAMLQDGLTVIVECSPHPVLIQPVQENIQALAIEAAASGTMLREQPETLSMAKALGEAWCHGARVEWRKYYGPRWERVTLPLYPWQKERYWFDESGSGGFGNSTRKDGSLGHPLLAGLSESDRDGIWLWETSISLQSFPYLSGHKVGESMIFPGAGYIEMLAAAAEEAVGQGEHIWEDIELKSALSLPEKGAVNVQLGIIRSIGDSYDCFIRTLPSGEEAAEILVEARLLARKSSSALLPEAGKWKVSGGEKIPKEQHYEATGKMFLPYEAAFTGLEEIERSGEYLRASVKLEDNVITNRHIFHPALLDGAVQAMLQPMYARYPGRTIVPVSIQKWRQLRWDKALKELIIVLHVTKVSERGVVCDAAIYSPKNELLAEWKGFTLEALEASATIDEIRQLLYTTNWHPVDTGSPVEAGRCVLYAPEKAVALKWQKVFKDEGYEAITVVAGEEFHAEDSHFTINTSSSQAQDQLWDLLKVEEIGRVVYVFPAIKNADAATIQQITIPWYKLVQALGKLQKTPPRLWLVTEGARQVKKEESVDVATAAAWGSVNVILNEHPELQVSRVDLPKDPSKSDISQAVKTIGSNIAENELALRDDLWLAARLEKFEKSEEASKKQLVKAAGKRYSAITTAPGLLDNLTLREKILSDPANNEVQVEIQAAGINFMNLMSALGIYPGKENGFATLGLEFSGVVKSAGSDVSDLKPGDIVYGMGYDTVASHINVDARKVVSVPKGMDPRDAAGIPVVYLTCWYALDKLARLQKGERVLIHSATGGVGLSAIQIAQLRGAEIFATAGSEEKRKLLRDMGITQVYDSRSVDFYDEILADTKGEGVDVVLNSLTGEAMFKSMQLLRKYGRFLEIGKKDVYSNSRIGLEAFGRSLSYHMIDLEMLSFDKPALIGEMLREITDHFGKGDFKVLPKTVFPVSDLKNAFAFMSKSKHTGKIIIDMQEEKTVIEPLAADPSLVRPDATYLLTGGYGGLGLTFAGWLIEKGARSLILTGRSGPKGDAAQKIEEWKKAGVNVEIATPDLENMDSLEKLLNTIPPSKPLKGVMHFAGLLDDASVLNLTDEQFRNVTGPKISGAWNLHELTKDMKLDWFVMPSSSTILFGSPGQAAYVAANSFLDALAQYRRSIDLPALSIQWGTVAGVGLAAAEANRLERLAEEGVAPLSTETCIQLYKAIAKTDEPVIGAFRFDLGKWEQAYGTAEKNPFFSSLRENTTQSVAAEAGYREYLLSLPDPQERLARIEERLKEKVGHVVKMDPEKIANKTPFKSLGIDSLMSIQLKNQLEKAFDLALSVTSFWTHANIRDYSKFLAEELGADVSENGDTHIAAETVAPTMQTDNDMPDMNDISTDELSKLLEEELKDL